MAHQGQHNTLPETLEQALQRMIATAVGEAVADHFSNHNNNHGADNSNEGCSYKNFMGYKPPTFDGTGGPIALTRWFEQTEAVFNISGCQDQDKVKFSTLTFTGVALSWWNTYVQSVGIDEALTLSWTELRERMITEYFPRDETRRLEQGLRNLKTVGNDLEAYNQRFTELVLMCPNLMTPESLRVELYMDGLPKSVQHGLMSSKPANLQEALTMARQSIKTVNEIEAPTPTAEDQPGNNKRKWEASPSSNYNNNFTKKSFTSDGKKGYAGNLPYCNECRKHHLGECGKPFCIRCQRSGHVAHICKSTITVAQKTPNAPRAVVCFECGQPGHYRNACPKKKANPNARR
ncbi:uncharacterized protein [Rutidosis leptorrhynchoides]|uniref:uncharacterized protein n=1 Tax=Rutidosis leptorrhynchoides TaxID=125765 RepID=UPI003A98F031